MARNESFFQRLNRLFRSGPSIQRRVKGYSTKSYYDTNLIQGNYGYRAAAPFGFGRENSPFSVLGSYGILDRMSRYAEFAEQEYTPEIAAALDIYADEIVGGDLRGKAFHIYSKKTQIKQALEELFYDVLNLEFNLRPWARNLCKYGDFFLYNEVLPEIGVINAQPMPVNEIEREEGYDEEDPYATRFKWLTRGNQYLENWQVTHFRILSNDLFLPYGSSILEPARRIWRQLTMMEDAMLVYRVVRSPERRVFYIDVGNIAPNDIPSYMEAAKASLRSHSIIDKTTGRQDFRYNPLAIDEDYYIPVRGNQSGTKIDTLAGGQHVTATEDVQYIQSKLFAALKVPKPYLNYDENLSAKATLAQEDVRFSRTINSIQKVLIAELNKLAMIHLFSKGFDGEDLISFELKLSNPSTIAVQQKLELWSTKMDIAGTAKETKLVDERWIQRNILELTEDDITVIEKGLYEDKIREVQLDAVAFEDEIERVTTTDSFSQSNYEMSGKDVPKKPASDDLVSNNNSVEILPRNKDNPYNINYKKGSAPIKATPFLTRHRRNRVRRVGQAGRANTANPDFSSMLHPTKNRSLRDIYDQEFLNNPFKRESASGIEETWDGMLGLKIEPKISAEMRSVFTRLKSHLTVQRKRHGILSEEVEEFKLEKTKNDDDVLLNVIMESADHEKTLHDIVASSNEDTEEDNEGNTSLEFELE